MSSVVIIDDDNELRQMLHDHLKLQGLNVVSFDGAQKAVVSLHSGQIVPSVVITDLMMPDISGLELIKRIRAKYHHVPIIMITAFGSIETAVDAMKKGAFDYITKPFKLSDFDAVLKRALQISDLATENENLREELKNVKRQGHMIGRSKFMKDLLDTLKRVAPAQSNVLITGESGTGKEVVARTIHAMSDRTDKPFIAINCTAIPDTLLESELFGHAKGAFTGADRKKTGLFEEANGGTLFLDEIGDMNPTLQAKLLRVIQERTIRPVGENKDTPINVRIIAATHKDLKKSIQEGLFREDLFYRLNVIPIQLAPLRYRKEDIPVLALSFLQRFAVANKSMVKSFSPEALQVLVEKEWPGNIRELENYVERITVMSQKPVVHPEDLPATSQNQDDFYGQTIQNLPSLEDLEKKYIGYVLNKVGGKKDKASHILGINHRTLYRKEKEYGFSSSEENWEE